MDDIREPMPSREELEVLLRDLGVDEILIARACSQAEGRDVTQLVKRFRKYARENPAVVLGALSALVVGGAVAAKTATRKPAKKRPSKRSAASKRTLIEPHKGDKRYIRRDAKGRIKESVDVGRSLAADKRRSSKRRAKSGQGDKGDR